MDTKFPSIEKLNHVIQNIRYDLGDSCPSNIPLVGTTKLHGVHADMVISSDSSIRLQSRNILELTPENDVYGFASWILPLRPTLLAIRDAYHERYREMNPETTIDSAYPLIIAGEFIGQGIQKRVAISKLSKRFVILSASINGTWQPDEAYGDISAEDKNIYNVVRGGVFRVDLELETPANTITKIEHLVDAVERECPFAKTFGISGMGEGIVWKAADPVRFQGPRFWCKSKGEKHAVSKTEKVKDDLNDKDSLDAFAAAVVTEPRLEQAWAYLEETGTPREVKATGMFVRWLVEDCLKEKREEIKEKRVDERKLKNMIASKGREWYMKKLDEDRLANGEKVLETAS